MAAVLGLVALSLFTSNRLLGAATGDFQLTVEPASAQTPDGGGTVQYLVRVGPIGDFSSAVTLSLAEPPAGVTATFSTNPVVPGSTSTMRVTVAADVEGGFHSLRVVGDAEGITRVATYQLALDVGLTPVPVRPPCPITVTGTVTEVGTATPLAGARIDYQALPGEPEVVTDAAGRYRVEIDRDYGFSMRAILDPDHWFDEAGVEEIPCGGARTIDFELLPKIRFTLTGKVVEGTAGPSSDWHAVATVPERPVAGAIVNSYPSSCFEPGTSAETQSMTTGADGVAAPARWDLGYNNTPREILSHASSVSGSSCFSQEPTASLRLDDYWPSSDPGFAPGFLPSSDTAASPTPLAIQRTYVVVPKCATTISGRVVRADNGLPAVGAQVRAATSGTGTRNDSWQVGVDGPPIVTGADGTFSFPARSVRLGYNNQPVTYGVSLHGVGTWEGWQGSIQVPLAGNCADSPSVEIQIQPPPVAPPGAIEGHLYDEETGLPVVGKRVCVIFVSCSEPTDATGRYRIENVLGEVAVNPDWILTHDSDYWATPKPGTSHPVVVVESNRTVTGVDLWILRKRFAAIEGIVTDPTTGQRVPTATVNLFGGCPDWPWAEEYCITTYDGTGGFRIDHIELGDRNSPLTVWLAASAPGHYSAEHPPNGPVHFWESPVDLEAEATTEAHPTLERIRECGGTATIRGVVTNEVTGEPIGGAIVTAHLAPDPAVTDAQGRYEIRGVPVSTNFVYPAQVTVEAEGFFTRTRTVTLACGALLEVPDRIPPEPGTGSLRIAKMLTSPPGVPVPSTFFIRYACQPPDEGVAIAGEVSLHPPSVSSELITGIPTGSRCIVMEVPPDEVEGHQWSSTVSGAPLTILEGTVHAVTIANTLTTTSTTTTSTTSSTTNTTSTTTSTTMPGRAGGCTPGYWKQPQHLGAWVGHGTGDAFDSTFGVRSGLPTGTDLLGALGLNGGGERALARHATAALLNASNSRVGYRYSAADVLQMVGNAYNARSFEATKDLFERANEAGCDLGRQPAPTTTSPPQVTTTTTKPTKPPKPGRR